jgi:hypothetical protein
VLCEKNVSSHDAAVPSFPGNGDTEMLNIIGDVDTNVTVDNVVDKHVLCEKNIWSHDAAVLGSPNNGDAETVSSFDNNIECFANHDAYNANVDDGDKHVLGEKDACSHEETFHSFSDSNDTELPNIISDVDKYVASDAETLNIIGGVDIGLTVDIDVDKQVLFSKDV